MVSLNTDPPAHGHEERQPGEGAEEPNETALLLPGKDGSV